MKQHSFRILNSTGDTEKFWDPRNPDDVAQARALFDELTKRQSHAAFKLSDPDSHAMHDDGTPVMIKEFDPTVEHTLITPPVVAG